MSSSIKDNMGNTRFVPAFDLYESQLIYDFISEHLIELPFVIIVHRRHDVFERFF